MECKKIASLASRIQSIANMKSILGEPDAFVLELSGNTHEAISFNPPLSSKDAEFVDAVTKALHNYGQQLEMDLKNLVRP